MRSPGGKEARGDEAGEVEAATNEEDEPVEVHALRDDPAYKYSASEDDEPTEESLGTGTDSGANPGHATELLFALGSVRRPSGS